MNFRTEFGVHRSICACEDCTTNCRHMPGFLIPADLARLIPPTADAFAWAEENLLASPGAVAMKDGRVFRIPTLVPAVKQDGSCIHLTSNGKCGIHANAPFGCAFFDCSPAVPGLAEAGLQAIMEDIENRRLYTLIWYHLFLKGKTQRGPEELRQEIREALLARSEHL